MVKGKLAEELNQLAAEFRDLALAHDHAPAHYFVRDLIIASVRAGDSDLDLDRAVILELLLAYAVALGAAPAGFIVGVLSGHPQGDLHENVAALLRMRALRIRSQASRKHPVASRVLACLARILPAGERSRFVAEELGNLFGCEHWWEWVDRLVDLAIETPRLAWLLRRGWREKA
jgi:hypothetical protein